MSVRHLLQSAALFALVSACGVSACGTLSRVEAAGARAALTGVSLPAGVRYPIQLAPQEVALAERVMEYPPAERHAMLALSGGGANGAFGAGVIVGWTRGGDRPQFDIVTGVSTGALTAPFAFLGEGWDDELELAYTAGHTRHMVRWRNFSGFLAPSLFSSNAIRRLIERNVTPELLRSVAAEHAKGRLLLVATTNLDAESLVVWDMGVIAKMGGAKGLELFRAVLLASSAMPGVFPPVLIDGFSPTGEAVRELHVDGGVSVPFLGVPQALPASLDKGAPARPRALYILINGQMTAHYALTGGHMRDIVARSFESWSNASLRAALAENAAYANRTGMDVYVTSIPGSAGSSSINFSPKSMRTLFDLGRDLSGTGFVWSRVNAPKTAPRSPTSTSSGVNVAPLSSSTQPQPSAPVPASTE